MAFPRLNGLRTIEFGTPGPMRERLNALVLEGRKRATAGLLQHDYIDQNETIEIVGEELFILNNSAASIGKVKVTKVEVVRFEDVADDFAKAEGEGDLTGDDFRNSHREYWSSLGINVEDDMLIVTVYFTLVSEGM